MKKTLALLLVCLSTMLVGCINTDLTLDIDRTGNATMSMKLLASENLMEDLTESNLQKIKKDYEADTVEPITANGQKGYLLTKNLGNLKDSNASEEDKIIGKEFEKYFDVNKESGLIFDTYDVNIKLKDILLGDMSSEDLAMLSYFGNAASMNFHFKSPFELIESNATNTVEEDGKTVYSWNYTLANIDNIKVKFKIINIINVGIILAGIVLILGLGFVYMKKRRKNKKA